jgi:predicted nucleic acid-binding protein
VQLVIADTGPSNYIILIGHADILPSLFHRVVLPAAVCDELKNPKTPSLVQQWIASPPPWVEAHQATHVHDPEAATLDEGEEAAIALAVELHADLILMDDREGVHVARSKGFRVTGTLGILAQAAQHRLLNLSEAFDRLKQTSFHYQQELLDEFLEQIEGSARP